jgi:hypothetical protein
MARLQHKRLEQAAEVRSYPGGQTEIFELDDFVIGRMVMHAGGVGDRLDARCLVEDEAGEDHQAVIGHELAVEGSSARA